MSNFINSKEFLDFCHQAFDNIPITVDFLDKDGRMIYINKAFADFLEIPKEKMIGKIVTDINPTSKFMETLKNKKADIARKHRFPNGKEAIVHRIPILDNEGNVVGGFGMILFEEISQMKAIIEKCDALDKELKLYKNHIAKFSTAKYKLDDIIGKSKSMKECKKKVVKFAQIDLDVLITGESGVGKELFAHAIHNESTRKNNPFISINCSAIPINLLESELFGYEEGAFTGAKKGGSIGKFELAKGGTIFLDEIGDMPYYMQAKILRVLQEKEIVRVGGKNTIPIDVRVCCATNRNLELLIKEGKFREDLYYRLNVLSIEIPPLRERKEDIDVLVDKFLSSFYKYSGLFRKIAKEVMVILTNYGWPGNVRELRNVVDKICVNAEETNIKETDLPDYILKTSSKNRYEVKDLGLSSFLDSIEKEIIINTLTECKNNKSEAAKKLKIPRISFYRKLEKYGIK
ncbi:sigma-54-dependent Fis family transcriptional regulator [Clostridium sp. DJ247]|uniref:sigma-54 interaction domain-containing protein n=1 Tax=Clostridium sp. DJ247 TaxID=2726188 RepID=UPI0016287CED|nr:sigma 54-interacting transcriptional regulator [Clostridium sp. DJ247]MBC2581928.1 sigma 54-interacting transcriptional regulator [Clostridium sp. DJ247]